jgi:undecaprenyl-diphosphatase
MTTSAGITHAHKAKGSGAPIAVAKKELGYGLTFLRQHGWRVLLVFAGVLLPLWGFAALALELREREIFFFDVPTMLALHRLASPQVDAFFVMVSKVGYVWGVLPADVIIVGWLVVQRRFRDGLFFGLAVTGSLILNVAAKNYFTRFRPDLWVWLQPEATYSFPSGHAMASATLATALIFLFWATRWRWLVTVTMVAFVILVGASRIYLGVHFPSDILAGWAAGTAWVVAMYQLVAGRAPTPQQTTDVAPAADTITAAGKPKT